MSDTSDDASRSRPSGLSRSIDALFDDEETAAAQVVWEEPSPDQPHAAEEGDPEAFRVALDAFLSADPMERDGLGRDLRAEAVPLRDENRVDALADGVERLALEAGGPPDQAALAMARHLLSPGVTSRIVARLGAAREEHRREELVRVCTLVGHEMAVAISDALSDTKDRRARRTFLDAMQAMGPDAMPVLETMMEDGRWYVVRNAVSVLGELDEPRSVEYITTSLAHTHPKVRREALLALAKVGGSDAGMLVQGMLQDPDAEVRLAAVMAAGELKVERALKPLLEILEEEDDEDVVIGVLRALGRLGDPGAVPTIEKYAVGSFFSRPPAEVRIAAYRALNGIGTPRAMGLLEEAMDDKDPQVRIALRRLRE